MMTHDVDKIFWDFTGIHPRFIQFDPMENVSGQAVGQPVASTETVEVTRSAPPNLGIAAFFVS